MNTLVTIAITAAITAAVSLVVTSLYNHFIGIPKKRKAAKDAEVKEKEEMKTLLLEHGEHLDNLQQCVDACPKYRQQTRDVEEELKQTDQKILQLCQKIQEGVDRNQELLNTRLDRLEKRERNALRSKILNEYRLFGDSNKNPLKAWSEMEHHSFFELVSDYEELGGNDYVHSVVLPAMNELHVIPMSNIEALEKLFKSRRSI